MQGKQRIFSYTAQKGAYLGLAGALGAMLLVEGGGAVALVALLMAPSLTKWLILGGIGGGLVFGLIVLFGPLFTRHAVDDEQLHLRYGLGFQADIPRTKIADVQPVRERTQVVSAKYDPAKRKITAPFSEHGQVLVRLREPHPVRKGLFGTQMAETILINVDQPAEFLGALAHATEPKHTAPDASPAVTQPPSPLAGPRPNAPSRPRVGTPAIHTEQLTRRYGSYTAVNNLQLAVYPGEIYGFLGANGAGKTSTIKMLVGLLKPTTGQVWLNGHNVWQEPLAAKSLLGFVPDRTPLYDRLTGREYLSFLGQMRGVPEQQVAARAAELIDLLGLRERADQPARTYSFGMKRKLAVAAALLHQPAVLILDEPFNGLDPRSSRNLKDLLMDIAHQGTAIFLSIHDLATAEAVCHRVGIIHRGTLVAEGDVQEIQQHAQANNLEEVFLNLTAPTWEEAE